MTVVGQRTQRAAGRAQQRQAAQRRQRAQRAQRGQRVAARVQLAQAGQRLQACMWCPGCDLGKFCTMSSFRILVIVVQVRAGVRDKQGRICSTDLACRSTPGQEA